MSVPPPYPALSPLSHLKPQHEFVVKHGQHIVDGCKEIVQKNAHVVVDAFSGEPPLPHTTYTRTLATCVDKMNLCDAPVRLMGCVFCGWACSRVHECVRMHQLQVVCACVRGVRR